MAPLTVAAGVVPTAFAVTGLTAIPVAFLAVAALLGLWAVGYVALARRLPNAGAFYALLARGLGRPAGVAAAFVAVLAYNLLQFGLYGAFGPFAAGWGPAGVPWWVYALAAWALVAVLGPRRIDVVARVLAVLATAELVVVVALTVVGLSHPAAGALSLAGLSPAGLLTGGLGALLAIAVLGFVGVESGAVFAEESRDPRRTIGLATYLSIAVVGVVYAAASFAVLATHGEQQVVGVAGTLGPDTLFALGGDLLADAGRILFATSMFAAMIAFHQAVGRYLYALGRDGVLPAALARTSRDGAPRNASLAQSGLALAVIAGYAGFGLDPTVHLFFWLGTTGGFGVLLLIAATSFAVIRYFRRNGPGDWQGPADPDDLADPAGCAVPDRHRETAWQRWISPGLAGTLLAVVAILVAANYATLLGVPDGAPAARLLPAAYVVAALAGLATAAALRAKRPATYRRIGQAPGSAR